MLWGLQFIMGKHRINPNTTAMKDMLASYILKQHISDSTHKSDHTFALVISIDNGGIIKSSTVSSLLADHLVILFNLNFQKPPLP